MQATIRSGHLAFLAVVAGLASACTICGEGGDVRGQITFRATFSPDDGGPTLSTERLVREGESGSFGPGGPWWETAMVDAGRVAPPATGTIYLLGTGDDAGLGLALPLPRTARDVLPVVKASGQGLDSFMFHPLDERSLFPADAATLAVGHAPDVPCTREMPDACLPYKMFVEQGALGGTVELVSVKPLRVHVDAVATWPAESGWAPTAVRGTVSFAMDHDEFCYHP
jgi:hypothetical protein